MSAQNLNRPVKCPTGLLYPPFERDFGIEYAASWQYHFGETKLVFYYFILMLVGCSHHVYFSTVYHQLEECERLVGI